MKKIGIVLALLLILVLLGAVLAPFMIDLNKYKGTILSRIEPHVPREVDFEHIELTVLSGFGAELRASGWRTTLPFRKETSSSWRGCR